MLPVLGHCEDSACIQSSHELVRLFRCSIHCDRNLCLYHLNAHNVYYEEEKKQNDTVICELENALTLYQTIFEQHILSYRELVRQASTILLHNTSTLIPIDQIRPILEKIQQAIALYQDEKIIIKCESELDINEIENDKTKTNNISHELGQKVVVRIPRIDCPINHIQQFEKDNDDDNRIERVPSPAYVARKIVNGIRNKSMATKRFQKLRLRKCF